MPKNTSDNQRRVRIRRHVHTEWVTYTSMSPLLPELFPAQIVDEFVNARMTDNHSIEDVEVAAKYFLKFARRAVCIMQAHLDLDRLPPHMRDTLVKSIPQMLAVDVDEPDEDFERAFDSVRHRIRALAQEAAPSQEPTPQAQPDASSTRALLAQVSALLSHEAPSTSSPEDLPAFDSEQEMKDFARMKKLQCLVEAHNMFARVHKFAELPIPEATNPITNRIEHVHAENRVIDAVLAFKISADVRRTFEQYRKENDWELRHRAEMQHLGIRQADFEAFIWKKCEILAVQGQNIVSFRDLLPKFDMYIARDRAARQPKGKTRTSQRKSTPRKASVSASPVFQRALETLKREIDDKAQRKRLLEMQIEKTDQDPNLHNHEKATLRKEFKTSIARLDEDIAALNAQINEFSLQVDVDSAKASS